jgi:hypothetical protein
MTEQKQEQEQEQRQEQQQKQQREYKYDLHAKGGLQQCLVAREDEVVALMFVCDTEGTAEEFERALKAALDAGNIKLDMKLDPKEWKLDPKGWKSDSKGWRM